MLQHLKGGITYNCYWKYLHVSFKPWFFGTRLGRASSWPTSASPRAAARCKPSARTCRNLARWFGGDKEPLVGINVDTWYMYSIIYVWHNWHNVCILHRLSIYYYLMALLWLQQSVIFWITCFDPQIPFLRTQERGTVVRLILKTQRP